MREGGTGQTNREGSEGHWGGGIFRLMVVHYRARGPAQYGITDVGHEVHEGRRQTGRRRVHAGSRLKLRNVPGRSRPTSQPSSRTGENSPYGMIGGIDETSASFEARSAPRSYPTEPHRPRAVRGRPRGRRRSVGRGTRRPVIEPR